MWPLKEIIKNTDAGECYGSPSIMYISCVTIQNASPSTMGDAIMVTLLHFCCKTYDERDKIEARY